MASQQQLTLKLLVDNSSDRVLFAEADKDVVDFLFSLLSIPVGTVVKLLATEGMPMVGCIGNLYKSVECLDDTCLQSRHARTLLLNPTLPSSASLPKNTLSLTGGSSPTGGALPEAGHALKFYRCTNSSSSSSFGFTGSSSIFGLAGSSSSFGFGGSSCGSTISRSSSSSSPSLTFGNSFANTNTNCGTYTSCCGTVCPLCHNRMSTEMRRVDSGSKKEVAAAASAGEAGFVKGVVTYTVTDDLTVTKLSSISSITMLAKCNVGDLGSLGERVAKIGMKEGLEILKASLQSKMVLTDVFIGDKKKRNSTS